MKGNPKSEIVENSKMTIFGISYEDFQKMDIESQTKLIREYRKKRRLVQAKDIIATSSFSPAIQNSRLEEDTVLETTSSSTIEKPKKLLKSKESLSHNNK